MSPLAVIGAGRVGHAVARLAGAAGIEVSLGGRTDGLEAAAGSRVALLCVPDSELVGACERISAAIPPLELVGHTSGVSGLDVLESARARGAETFSIHPLQTIPDADSSLAGTPCAIAGSSPAAEEAARELALRLEMTPFAVPETARAAYHAAASISSNFLIALEETAVELLERAGIENGRELLAPLVLRTAANWTERGGEALTGPIARGDEDTVESHTAAIASVAPELTGLYEALAERARAVATRPQETSGAEAGQPRGGGIAIVRTRAALREALAGSRGAGRTIGLVPTMGALHPGHASLIRAARRRCDVVVVTLFVNPTQFGSAEDIERYPCDEARDAEVAAAEGADLLFAPDVGEVYPSGRSTWIDVGGAAEVLCGAPEHRGSAHFRGVATVVAKLFNMVQPDIAYFGQKDAQQAIVIRRMVRDLDFPIRIEVLPTVREPDGLALSSRNAYLDAPERKRAAALYAALLAVEEGAARDESVDAALDRGRRVLAEAGIDPEYLEARDAEDLSPVDALSGRAVLVAVAAKLGSARLIDNVVIEPTQTN